MEIQQLFDQLAVKGPKKPRKQRITHIYSRDYFDTKVKAQFEVLWAAEQIRPLKPGEKVTKRLDFSNRVTAQYLDAESEDFKTWLKAVAESEHRDAVEQWQMKKERENGQEAQTAEGYQK